jgi:hypothetical protein
MVILFDSIMKDQRIALAAGVQNMGHRFESSLIVFAGIKFNRVPCHRKEAFHNSSGPHVSLAMTNASRSDLHSPMRPIYFA